MDAPVEGSTSAVHRYSNNYSRVLLVPAFADSLNTDIRYAAELNYRFRGLPFHGDGKYGSCAAF
jgi:hypothetical protein